jgi:hypothetical protein
LLKKKEGANRSMQPQCWQPSVELSAKEEQVVKRIRKAKLFVFLRRYRHKIFDEAFQQELATLYQDSKRGQPPIAPAQLALATIVQAYMGVSDDEVIEAIIMDRRYQLVLNCLDTEEVPFSKGTLVNFRKRLIDANIDRRLIERTVEVAEQSCAFGSRALRAALDSSPLWGAGRVEDTYNLVGHALRKVVSVVAAERERELAGVAKEAKAELLCGSSLKAALDCDWDQPGQKMKALSQVLSLLQTVEQWFHGLAQEEQTAQAEQYLHDVQHIKEQNVEQNENGEEVLKDGVAKDRRISIEDDQMRHGRKSSSVLINGYKRHVLHDLDSGLVRAVGITAANAPEASVTVDISVDLIRQAVDLQELHIDRAYLSSEWVRQRTNKLEIYCKAWPVRQGKFFSKQTFHLDWDRKVIRCPAEQEMPFKPSGVVHFPQELCAKCQLHAQCTKSSKGRSVSIHPDEQLMAELRERQLTPVGRAKLRERVAVEHTLAHIGHWQGRRARYRGLRKNLFDLRRCAVIHNLHVLSHSDAFVQAA